MSPHREDFGMPLRFEIARLLAAGVATTRLSGALAEKGHRCGHGLRAAIGLGRVTGEDAARGRDKVNHQFRASDAVVRRSRGIVVTRRLRATWLKLVRQWMSRRTVRTRPTASGAATHRATATRICAVWPDHSPLSSQVKAVE